MFASVGSAMEVLWRTFFVLRETNRPFVMKFCSLWIFLLNRVRRKGNFCSKMALYLLQNTSYASLILDFWITGFQSAWLISLLNSLRLCWEKTRLETVRCCCLGVGETQGATNVKKWSLISLMSVSLLVFCYLTGRGNSCTQFCTRGRGCIPILSSVPDRGTPVRISSCPDLGFGGERLASPFPELCL